METTELIHYIKDQLQQGFGYPENKLYCQVASISDGKPRLRTMDLYQITDLGEIVLLTATHSNKWADLNACPQVSICVSNSYYGQILLAGDCALKTVSSDREEVSAYWRELLDDYWREFYLDLGTANEGNNIPLSFGAIVFKPNYCDILAINSEDYRMSSRQQYQLLEGTEWSCTNVDPI